MTWLTLAVAGGLEIAFVYALDLSDGFSRPAPAVAALVLAAASLFLLSQTMLRGLPASVAYPVWSGIGAAGSTVLGAVVLGDPASPLRFAAIALIAGGVVVLQRHTHHEPPRRPVNRATALP